MDWDRIRQLMAVQGNDCRTDQEYNEAKLGALSAALSALIDQLELEQKRIQAILFGEMSGGE